MTRSYAVYDIEYTASYFEVGFYNGDKFIIMELPTTHDTITPAQKKTLKNIFQRYTLVGFNSQKFDDPILQGFYQGLTARQLSEMGSKIIDTNENRWWISNPNYDNSLFDSLDIMKSVPGRMSLKTAGARMCSDKLIDNPVDFRSEKILTQAERDKYIEYNKNDLELTWQLLQTLMPLLDRKIIIGKEIGKDLRSKNEPKISELYLKKDYKQNKPPKKASYNCPYPLQTDQAKGVARLFNGEYVVSESGYPQKKDWPEIDIAGRKYAIGLGGLHSVNPAPERYTDLTDIDVTSYYPSMLINFEWDKKYNSVYYDRLKAKRSGDKVKSDNLKLVLNSAFGKLCDKYSALYDPDRMLQVTLTGQLLLIELIARLAASGAKVIYANTDGIIVTGKYDPEIIRQWEKDYTLEMEEEPFDEVFIRDVNNLFAVHDKKIVKRKGVFAGKSLRKGYEHPLVYENAMHILMGEEPKSLRDNKKELLITRGSKSWCTWDDEVLGKVVRWVWVKDGLPIKNDVGKVANSDSCYPIMDLAELDTCHDIDYDRYETEINEIVLMFS